MYRTNETDLTGRHLLDRTEQWEVQERVHSRRGDQFDGVWDRRKERIKRGIVKW